MKRKAPSQKSAKKPRRENISQLKQSVAVRIVTHGQTLENMFPRTFRNDMLLNTYSNLNEALTACNNAHLAPFSVEKNQNGSRSFIGVTYPRLINIFKNHVEKKSLLRLHEILCENYPCKIFLDCEADLPENDDLDIETSCLYMTKMLTKFLRETCKIEQVPEDYIFLSATRDSKLSMHVILAGNPGLCFKTKKDLHRFMLLFLLFLQMNELHELKQHGPSRRNGKRISCFAKKWSTISIPGKNGEYTQERIANYSTILDLGVYATPNHSLRTYYSVKGFHKEDETKLVQIDPENPQKSTSKEFCEDTLKASLIHWFGKGTTHTILECPEDAYCWDYIKARINECDVNYSVEMQKYSGTPISNSSTTKLVDIIALCVNKPLAFNEKIPHGKKFHQKNGFVDISALDSVRVLLEGFIKRYETEAPKELIFGSITIRRVLASADKCIIIIQTRGNHCEIVWAEERRLHVEVKNKQDDPAIHFVVNLKHSNVHQRCFRNRCREKRGKVFPIPHETSAVLSKMLGRKT
jgi:hypothetical protein